MCRNFPLGFLAGNILLIQLRHRHKTSSPSTRFHTFSSTNSLFFLSPLFNLLYTSLSSPKPIHSQKMSTQSLQLGTNAELCATSDQNDLEFSPTPSPALSQYNNEKTPHIDFVIPSNTTLPESFYSNYNITYTHIKLNNTSTPIPVDNEKQPSSRPTTPTTPIPHIDLFKDLHEDHSLETNVDLMYEMLFQASEHVPMWNAIPFEVFCEMVQIRQLLGGFSNFLVSFELVPEQLHSTKDHSLRPATLQNIIAHLRDANPQHDELVKNFSFSSTITTPSTIDAIITIPQPTITKVAVRIYGTAEFTDRGCELALAKAASDKKISEIVFASWRHGRIASFLDGSSLGYLKWYDPIITSLLGYTQGQLHSTNFKQCFEGTTMQLPSIKDALLHHVLSDWCMKSFNTKIYKSLAERAKQQQPISSVFDMFQTSANNSLYVLNRPACAVPTPVRCEQVILPLPKQLESIVMPMFNAYQIDLNEGEDKALSEFTDFPYRSQRTKSLNEFVCVQNGLLKINEVNQASAEDNIYNDTIAETGTVFVENGQKSVEISNKTTTIPPSRLLTPLETDLILQYLDLPRLKKEINWLLSLCTLFPVVTAHNDYHAGNVLLLNSLRDGPSTPSNSSNLIQSNTIPIHPLPYPNEGLQWLRAIDWEHGGFNYRGYDTANSSNEAWIVYAGSHPGFTIDMPAWLSTSFLGIYDPNAMKLDPNQAERVKDCKYQAFEHPAVPAMCDVAHMDTIAKVWNQCESPLIGEAIQHILLGSYATQEYSGEAEKTPVPTFRPREITWAEACLTGFYQSTKQQHYQTSPDPENTPIYPFQSTSPAKPSFDPLYTLPDTLEEWLADQLPKLLYETMVLQLASQLAWVFWGITFTDAAVVEGFGYLEHALARAVAYVAKKELLIKLDLLKSPYETTSQQ